MHGIRICDDLEECRSLWEALYPADGLFDLWPVREAFQGSFGRAPYFLVAERAGKAVGLAPLSRLEEAGGWGFFPGETWRGKTWLEQNRLIARDPAAHQALLDELPRPLHLRYLTRCSLPLADEHPVTDEVGYLFLPQQYGADFSEYWRQFPGKRRRKLESELSRLEARDVRYRYDCFDDVQQVFRMNLEAFEEKSYFHDPRFISSFDNLIRFLWDARMLRVTTVLIGGKVAAVDLGAVFRGTYTVLAGGASGDFPGVAKLINLHHLKWACDQRLKAVDFLCGDFGWKERFRLSPRPLYEIRLDAAASESGQASNRMVLHG